MRLWDSEDILEIAFRDAAAISMRRRPSLTGRLVSIRLIARITRWASGFASHPWDFFRPPAGPGQLGLTLLALPCVAGMSARKTRMRRTICARRTHSSHDGWLDRSPSTALVGPG